jgi:uncharacterized protein
VAVRTPPGTWGQLIERGLASLPPPSPGDLFFDIAHPYAFDDGLDYLFGILQADGTFTAIWAQDETGDSRASRAASSSI